MENIGGVECVNRFREIFDELADTFHSENASTLTETMGLCNAVDPTVDAELTLTIYSLINQVKGYINVFQ